MTLQRITSFLGISSLLAMLLAVLTVAVSEVHSFDVFWQLQSGKYIWQTKSFIHTDLFTLMKDVPRPEHTWLHSLILYFVYLIGGYEGISVFKGVLITISLGVLLCAARYRGASVYAIALVSPIFVLTSGGWLERPQLWTFFCFAVFVFALQVFLQRRSWNILWLIPLAVFWGNAHAGSVLAVAVFSAYFVGEAIQAAWKKRLGHAGLHKLLVLLLGILVAGLINPYPSKLLSSLLGATSMGTSIDASGKSTGSMVHVFNMDWTATTFQQEPMFFYAMGAVAVILLLGYRRIHLADLCLMAGLAIMGLQLVRHIPFFYMGALVICPVYLDAAVEPIRKRLPDLYQKIASVAVICIAIAAFWYVYQPVYNVYGSFNTGLRTWHYPIEATEFVEEHNLPKNIYNTYDWGGYMAWQLYPEYLVFWDGRQNSAEMFRLGWEVMAGKPNWQQVLDQFDVNTIVSRASTIDTGQKYPLLDRLKADNNWALVFNTESSMVFVRKDSVPSGWLERYARPKERMDDTILAEAHLMVKYNANRYMAWWSMAEIYTKRKQYKNALFAVNQHLARAPKPHPAAVNLQKQLAVAVKRGGG